MHGRCHLFALAAHRILRKPIEIAYEAVDGDDDDDDAEEESVGANHAYVVLEDGSNGKFVLDVNGRARFRSMWKRFWAEYRSQHPDKPLLASVEAFQVSEAQLISDMQKVDASIVPPLNGEMALLEELVHSFSILKR